ncbi:g5623 [Coccomyxa elongata]
MATVLRLVQLAEDLHSVGAVELAASTSVNLLNAFDDLSDQVPVENALSPGLASRIAEIAYLVALQLLQLRAAPECTSILQQLGCTYRLSDAVLQWSIQNAHAHAGLLHRGHPCTLIPALPDDVFNVLEHGFSASAKFWSETGYMNQDSPFSSILYDLDPSNAMEAAINSIFQDLKQSHLDMSGILAAEWWAHMREPTSAHQLHFDLDESRIGVGAAKYRLLHPVLSSVLYLSSTGGPTVVLEQSATDTLAEQAFLCNPKENVLFCFPGKYLHGVLPGQQPVGIEPGGTQRISLIIAWWGHGLQAKAGAPGTGPCRSLPTAPEALLTQHSQTWLSDFPLPGGAMPPQRRLEWKPAALVAPAWVPVARSVQATVEKAVQGSLGKGHVKVAGASEGDEGLTRDLGGAARTRNLPLPGLRFFLRAADEVRQVYVPQS